MTMLPTVAVAATLSGVLIAQQHPANPFAIHETARADGRYRMLLHQFRAERPNAAAREAIGFQAAKPRFEKQRGLAAGHWVWQRPFWFVFRDGPDDVAPNRSWGPEAACGPPDTQRPGDHGTAWATKGQDDRDEWLLLEWTSPVRVTAIEIHETFNPGAIRAVEILRPDGTAIEIWTNAKPAPIRSPGRVLKPEIPLGFTVQRVRLRFACDQVPGWNEIDAVGLKDPAGKLHWAAHAAASTTFADNQPVAPVGMPVPMVAPAIVKPAAPPPAAPPPNRATELEREIADLEARLAKLRAELGRARRR